MFELDPAGTNSHTQKDQSKLVPFEDVRKYDKRMRYASANRANLITNIYHFPFAFHLIITNTSLTFLSSPFNLSH